MLWKIQLRRKIKIYVLLLLGFGALLVFLDPELLLRTLLMKMRFS